MSPKPFSRQQRLALLSSLSPQDLRELHTKVASIGSFAIGFVGVSLFPYQLEAAEAVLRSIFARDGDSFVLIFARQSGKDELIANLLLYLLARFAEIGASFICAQPTFRPQTLNAIDRLQSRLSQRPFFESGGLRRHHGYVYRLLNARLTYLSADPSASVVGATADRLLIVNEAQDVQPALYDKRFAPMAASGNATRLFCGTSWTSDTLLEREKNLALQRERRDGLRRLFRVDADQVSRINPFYARHVDLELARLGRDHPLIRTQYYCETVDARNQMFPPALRALMLCAASEPRASIASPRDTSPGDDANPSSSSSKATTRPHALIAPSAFLLDLAGMDPSSASNPPNSRILPKKDMQGRTSTAYPFSDSSSPPPGSGEGKGVRREAASSAHRPVPGTRVLGALRHESQGGASATSSPNLHRAFEPHSNYSRDSVTLRIVHIDLSTLETLQAPTYRVVHTRQWTGANHLTVFGQIKALAEAWRPLHIVIDATGVGEGLWAMLDKAFPTRVIPVKFTTAVKSELGYRFLAVINTGRFKDCDPSPETDRQYAACEREILIGPTKTMRWGVPEGRRDADGLLLHDDIPLTDCLVAELDQLDWYPSSPSILIQPPDPLDDLPRLDQ